MNTNERVSKTEWFYISKDFIIQFSMQYITTIGSRRLQMFLEIVFLKFGIFTENACVGVSFWYRTLEACNSIKKYPNTDVFL